MKILLTSLLALSFSISHAQHDVYNKKGKKAAVSRTQEVLVLQPSKDTVQIKRSPKMISFLELESMLLDSTLFGDETKEFALDKMLWGIADIALTVAKEVISVGYKVSLEFLEKRIEKFSAEYEREISNLNAGSDLIPNVKYQRSYFVENENEFTNGLSIELEAHPVEDLDYFYYSVKSINLERSKAKTTKKSPYLDYSIVIQATFLQDTTVKTITTAPIQILSAAFGINNFSLIEYPSDLIPIPKDSYLLKVGVKIIETNPQKVDAQDLLDFWKKLSEENGESLESMLKSIFGTEEEDS